MRYVVIYHPPLLTICIKYNLPSLKILYCIIYKLSNIALCLKGVAIIVLLQLLSEKYMDWRNPISKNLI